MWLERQADFMEHRQLHLYIQSSEEDGNSLKFAIRVQRWRVYITVDSLSCAMLLDLSSLIQHQCLQVGRCARAWLMQQRVSNSKCSSS